MHLNCKVGDLAVVVNAEQAENIGQIVEVLGPQRGVPFRLAGPGHVWHTRTASGRCSLHYRFDHSGVVRHAEGPVPDCRLRPVSGLHDPEALPRTAGARRRDERPEPTVDVGVEPRGPRGRRSLED